MTDYRIATLADIEELEKTPLAQRLGFGNTYELVTGRAKTDPDTPALTLVEDAREPARHRTQTYAQLAASITQAANLFASLGVAKDDVVSYLMPNLPETHWTLWGAEAAGIANPINYMLEPHIIAEIMEAAGTKVLVAHGPENDDTGIWKKVQAILGGAPGRFTVLRVGGPGQGSILGFEEALAAQPGDRLATGRVIAPGDIASIYHTGGTTGRPKLAPRTHMNEVALTTMFELMHDLAPGEAIFCGLPLFHVNGTIVTGALPFMVGAHVVLLTKDGYRGEGVIENFYRLVERYRAVNFAGVPTILSMLLEHEPGGADISSLRVASCGAAPLSVELFKRFEAHTNMKIAEGYGLTEGTCVSAMNPLFGQRKIGSVGLRLPYQDMRIFILDENGGFVREAVDNEIGVVHIKGPNVITGYLEEEHNRGLFPRSGWLNTGDMGRRDAEGYFWLTGRKKELIIRGGHNIDPQTIEDPAYRIPGVQLAAAVGRPDPHSGEVPIVFIQPAPGADITPQGVLEQLKKSIGERAARPKEVIFIDEMPLTSVGKLFKPALAQRAVALAYARQLEGLGAVVKGVDVKEHKTLGRRATIRLDKSLATGQTELERQVAERLALFTVAHDIIWE